MWGLILAVVAISIACDCEMRLKKLQNRLWEDEQRLQRLHEELEQASG